MLAAHVGLRRDPETDEEPLEPDDLALCEMLLSAVPNGIDALNDGLRTIQFQSLSFNPQSPTTEIFGGTQDNGTWSFDSGRSPRRAVVRDGGRRRRSVGL